jgi:hypothetical protein
MEFGRVLAGNPLEDEMSNSFMSELPTFTLESLVTEGQWTAAQTNVRKKTVSKITLDEKTQESAAPQVQEPKLAL